MASRCPRPCRPSPPRAASPGFRGSGASKSALLRSPRGSHALGHWTWGQRPSLPLGPLGSHAAAVASLLSVFAAAAATGSFQPALPSPSASRSAFGTPPKSPAVFSERRALSAAVVAHRSPSKLSRTQAHCAGTFPTSPASLSADPSPAPVAAAPGDDPRASAGARNEETSTSPCPPVNATQHPPAHPPWGMNVPAPVARE
mmetsp:Transcript_42881/g.93297  ORF Transcript_42881/g.93297 Transcript_42881/m.93297 type:complete len:201 (+) Transcript_42881:396-998(+)